MASEEVKSEQVDKTPEEVSTADGIASKSSRLSCLRLIGIFAALIAVGGLLFWVIGRKPITAELNRPLGPTLPPLPTPTASTDQQGPGISPIATTPAPAQENQPDPICDGPPQMTILAIGADTQTTGFVRGLADVIRVVRVDFVTPSITMLTVPRDLWLPLPGLEDYGPQLQDFFGIPLDENGEEISYPAHSGRINVAYFYGNLYGLPGSGPGILAQALYYQLGIPVDHYIAVNMGTLAEIIDAVGGVNVEVTLPTNDIPAGTYYMSGEEALRYARSRKDDNDWYRSERQNDVLGALRDKALQPSTLASIPAIYDAFENDILTDLSKAQITTLTCLLNNVEREAITTYTIGPDMVTQTYTSKGAFALLPDYEKISVVVETFMTHIPELSGE